MSLLSVKFAPLETDMSDQPEPTEDGRDDGGDYYDDEYPYPYDDDEDLNNGHRDAVPLVGDSSRQYESIEALVDPERRAICWPVYLVVALCIGLLTAAVVLIPPADETATPSSSPSSVVPSASPSSSR
jgi:hypothetical protein